MATGLETTAAKAGPPPGIPYGKPGSVSSASNQILPGSSIGRRTTYDVRTVAAAGVSQHIDCRGSGPLTLIVIAGLDDSASSWSKTAADFRAITRTCFYDRPGLGVSPARSNRAQTVDAGLYAHELTALLKSANEAGPYLVLGHSFGGLIARAFIRENRSKVHGLLLAESVDPTDSTLPAFWREAGHLVNMQLSKRAAGGRSNLGDLPLLVLSASNPERNRLAGPAFGQPKAAIDLWVAQQHADLRLSSNAIQVIATSGHEVEKDAPALVVQAVQTLFDAVAYGNQLGCQAIVATPTAGCLTLTPAAGQGGITGQDVGPSTNSSPAATANPIIEAIPDSEWAAITAAGVWHLGCPVGQSQLRRVEVNFHGFDGAIHRGTLVVRTDVAASVARIFTRLFDSGFPIHRMVPIEVYHGDDNASMAADNTSAFNCRNSSQANAPAAASPHANGRAIDINPFENPWVDPRCNCYRPDTKFAGLGNTVRSGAGVITKNSVAWKAFIAEGWIWQDNSTSDYQHFDTGYPSHPLTAKTKNSTFPVKVAPGNASQIITVKTSGTTANVSAWSKSASGWHLVISTSLGHIGSKGITNGSTRKQNTYTTPSGTYGITQSFGTLANPGTALPYHVVKKDDWWVEDNNSFYYNTMRTASQGGFNMALPESDVNGSERLIHHKTLYGYALVINYNMNPAVPYRGAGIFLHISNGQPTAGCVSVPKATLLKLLRWLKPSAHPRISIG